jgi:hypothetical protein
MLRSMSELPDLLPADRRVQPEQDDAWRSAEHQAWRRFVEATAALDPRG